MYPYTIRIPYAPQITTKIGPHASAFVCEIDAELVVDYETPENWEIVGLRFEQTRWNPEFEVTPESDALLWKLIERAIDMDDKAVAAKVEEMICEDYTDRRNALDDAADRAYDAWVESR